MRLKFGKKVSRIIQDVNQILFTAIKIWSIKKINYYG